MTTARRRWPDWPNQPDAHAAVDHQHGAGGEARLIASEIEHSPGHLFGTGVAAERDHLVEHLRGVAADDRPDAGFDLVQEFIIDRAGMDGVDADAAWRQRLGEAAHQTDLGVPGANVPFGAWSGPPRLIGLAHQTRRPPSPRRQFGPRGGVSSPASIC
jgi:hypothetical protein